MRKKLKASFTLTTGKCIICSLSYKTKSKLTVHKKEHKFHFREFTQHVENIPFCWLIHFIVKDTLKVVTQRCLSATIRQCCLNQAPFYLHAGPVMLLLTLTLYGGLLEDINLTALLFFYLFYSVWYRTLHIVGIQRNIFYEWWIWGLLGLGLDQQCLPWIDSVGLSTVTHFSIKPHFTTIKTHLAQKSDTFDTEEHAHIHLHTHTCECVCIPGPLGANTPLYPKCAPAPPLSLLTARHTAHRHMLAQVLFTTPGQHLYTRVPRTYPHTCMHPRCLWSWDRESESSLNPSLCGSHNTSQ